MNTMTTTALTEIEAFILDTIRSRQPEKVILLTGLEDAVRERFAGLGLRRHGSRDRRVDNALRKLKAHGLIRYFDSDGWRTL